MRRELPGIRLVSGALRRDGWRREVRRPDLCTGGERGLNFPADTAQPTHMHKYEMGCWLLRDGYVSVEDFADCSERNFNTLCMLIG